MSPMNMKVTTYTIVQVALSSPLRHSFTYLLPTKFIHLSLIPGMRVKIPFRKKDEIGVILALQQIDKLPERRLREVTAILDQQPILPPLILKFIIWASEYYHYAIGECIISALPTLLRQGAAAELNLESLYILTPAGRQIELSQLTRSPQQAVVLAALKQHPYGCTSLQIKSLKLSRTSLQALLKKGWVKREKVPQPIIASPVATTEPISLNTAQQQAVQTVSAKLTCFQTFLLYGVTGSGKTEVYLQLIAKVLAANQQALILVPEIGLTPQTMQRFQQRFAVNIVALHSSLTDRERLNAWLMAKTGQAAIIIGTRSAIFTPLLKPGIIIIDEEHDASFKQQDGFRYSARDLAIVRGRMEGIPIILGSATPSLESLHNAYQHRYQLLTLPERAGNALPPKIRLIDMRSLPLAEGLLSSPLLQAINQHLAADGQVLLFLNRRGYAPILLCHSCGWIAHCQHCDAHMTFHQSINQLHCHHCGAIQRLLNHCPQCHHSEFIPLGVGTERLEQALRINYNPNSIIRIDRDSTRRKGALQALFDTIHSGQSCILIGTQMLAKGHHFPKVTLVSILNADGGLYSVDFRAIERLAQLIIQVAGRAGRAEKPGEVLIQTHNPDHPLLQQLIQHGYLAFAQHALQERQQVLLPPFSYQVLLRAEASNKIQPEQFLKQVKHYAQTMAGPEVKILGPIPALMERKGGYHRAQLLLQAAQRPALQVLLNALIPAIESLKTKRQVRWAIDVDPIDML